MKKLALRERIANAETETEISDLLKEGASYEFASNKTRRSWKRWANRKFNSFAAPQPVEQKMTAPKKKKKKVVTSSV